MIIKVCGMRDADNIRAVEALGIDWMGFIFWEPSKRHCAEVPAYLPTQCKRVGVFVDAEIADIVQHVRDYNLNLVQLHGAEDRAYVMQLRQALAAAQLTGREIVKAMAIRQASELGKCEPLVGFVDYFLFDTPTPGKGGSGKSFDWSLLDGYRYMTPFILSGGIGPDSIPAIKAFVHPCCMGIDLNSKFESAPGTKDVSKLREFIVDVKSM